MIFPITSERIDSRQPPKPGDSMAPWLLDLADRVKALEDHLFPPDSAPESGRTEGEQDTQTS